MMRYKPVCVPYKKKRRAMPRKYKKYQKKRVYKRNSRKGSIYGKVFQVAYGISRSISKDIRRVSKLGKGYKVVPRDQYVYNNAGRTDVPVGLQSTTVIPLYDKTDITSIKGNISGSNNTARLYLDQCNSTFRFTNQGITALWITLYHIVCRKDNSTFTTCANAWQTGIQDESGGASAYTHFGSIPTSSVSFNSYFKIKRIHKVALQAGASHEHTVQIHPRRVINYEEFNNVTYGVKDITSYVMFTASTSAYNDSTTKTSVTLGNGHLDYVYHKSYKYGWISDEQTSYYESNNLAGTFAVNQDVMQLAPGVVTGDSSA